LWYSETEEEQEEKKSYVSNINRKQNKEKNNVIKYGPRCWYLHVKMFVTAGAEKNKKRAIINVSGNNKTWDNERKIKREWN
jgi:hypothetical protein